ncbi:MAG TPA: hypothetical protein VKW08_18895 [Xanthobacteraceae bacterium]|nr:hypothetical protein [Xanthobacteraceae bacterium]
MIDQARDSGYGRRWFETALWALDSRLRARRGVHEYTQHRDCVFRFEVVSVTEPLQIPGEALLSAGERIIELHMWSEQFPQMPAAGPTIAWARRVRLSLDLSLHELALYLSRHRSLDDVKMIRANMSLAGARQGVQYANLMAYFGFVSAPPPARARRNRLHRFGENILITAMVWARNPIALRRDSLWRTPFAAYLPRRCLERRYGTRRAQESAEEARCRVDAAECAGGSE